MILVDDRLNAAREHAAAGRHDNAALLFESVLDISPGHPGALTGLIETRLARGDLQAAQGLLSKATALSEQDAGFLALAAKVALAAENAGEAERLCDRALAIDPFHVQAALLKAEFLATAGALADVEALLNAVRAQSDSPDILQGVARFYFSIGLFGPALVSAQEAQALSPDDPALNALVGQLLTALEDHVRATPFLQKAHLQDPANPEFLLALANNTAAIGELTEALRLASRATTLFPDMMPAWLSYIRIKAQRGEAEEALRDFAPVARNAKNRTDAMLTLGTAYGLAGEPGKSLQLLAPLQADVSRLDGAERSRLLVVLRDAYLSTGQLAGLPDLLLKPVCDSLGLQGTAPVGEEALAEQLQTAAMVVDPDMSNLEFMALARFATSTGRGRKTPVIGPAAMSGLVRLFGFETFLPNDARAAAPPETDISAAFPVSLLPGLPPGLRGGLTGTLPYLPVREDLLTRWRDALTEFPRPWIGLAWNEAHPGLTLDALLSGLPELTGTLISTNWDHSRTQLKGRAGIIDAGRHIATLEDLAALVHVLDFVISPDGIALHAAGATGTPGLALTSHVSPWYWAGDAGTSLWYPSLEVLRAPRPGPWATLMPEMASNLETALKDRF